MRSHRQEPGRQRAREVTQSLTDAEIIALWKQGMSDHAIATFARMSEHTVRSRRTMLALTAADRDPVPLEILAIREAQRRRDRARAHAGRPLPSGWPCTPPPEEADAELLRRIAREIVAERSAAHG